VRDTNYFYCILLYCIVLYRFSVVEVAAAKFESFMQ